jgi:hypothetical protein
VEKKPEKKSFEANFMRMEMKQRNCWRRPQNSNMRSSHSTFRNDLKSVKLAYTLVVLLTFGLIQSGEFFVEKLLRVGIVVWA